MLARASTPSMASLRWLVHRATLSGRIAILVIVSASTAALLSSHTLSIRLASSLAVAFCDFPKNGSPTVSRKNADAVYHPLPAPHHLFAYHYTPLIWLPPERGTKSSLRPRAALSRPPPISLAETGTTSRSRERRHSSGAFSIMHLESPGLAPQ